MKRVMTNVLVYLLGVVILLFLLHTRVTFSPFSIHFENWRFLVGLFVIFVGVEICCWDATKKSQQKFVEILNDIMNEKEKTSTSNSEQSNERGETN